MYSYPSLPGWRVSQMWEEYHRDTIRAVMESWARMTGMVLVRGRLLSPASRKEYASRAFRIGREIYYALRPIEMPRKAKLAWDHESAFI